MQEEVAHYINKARGYGLKDPEIKKHLVEAGWDGTQIDETFATIDDYKSRVLTPKESLAFQPAIQSTSDAQEGLKTSTAQGKIPKSASKLKYILGAVTAVLVAFLVVLYLIIFQNLSVFGFSAFGFVLNRVNSNTEFAITQDTSFSYEDSESFSVPALGTDIPAFNLKNLSAQVQEHSSEDAKKSQAGSLEINLANNGYAYKNTIEYKKLGTDLYANLSEDQQNKFITNAVKTLIGSDISGQWVKFTLTENAKQDTNSSQVKDVVDGLRKNNFISHAKLAGIEKVNGYLSLHYELSINEDALKSAVENQVEQNTKSYSATDAAEIKDVADTVLKKIVFKKLGVWISISKFSIDKIHIETSAPSIASAVSASVDQYSSTLAKANDEKRIADMRVLQSALELFYNDNNGYPDALSGQPTGLFPKYVVNMPEAPAATGNCSDYYNAYWYTPAGTAKSDGNGGKIYSSYSLSFCLGETTGNIQAGLGQISPEGLTTTTVCPDTVHPCFLPESREAKTESIAEAIGKINFSGNLVLDMLLSDKQSEEIIAPANALDLTQTASTLGGMKAPTNP